MGNKIFGVIRDAANGGAPVRGLRVQAWDEDWPDGDDFMGQDITDGNGEFEIRYRAGHWDRAIGGLPTWHPDIYLTVEIKNSKKRWVRIAKSGIFKDHNLDHDLRIDMEVSLKAPISKHSSFIPETHGFNFVNSFKVKPDFLGVDLGTWAMGFCGGMCAGALHRFHKGIGVPTNTIAPLDGTPLHEELMRRQIAAMSPEMLPIMYDWQSAPDVPTPMRKTSISKRTKNEWPKLQLMLDNMRPAILVLIRSSGYFGNPTRNHQVLAVGYDFDPASLDLVVHTYDPNKPNQPQTLALNLGLPDGKLYLKDSASRTTRGFFVNPVGEKATRMAAVDDSG